MEEAGGNYMAPPSKPALEEAGGDYHVPSVGIVGVEEPSTPQTDPVRNSDAYFDGLARPEAETMLRRFPKGTYLLRPPRDAAAHVATVSFRPGDGSPGVAHSLVAYDGTQALASRWRFDKPDSERHQSLTALLRAYLLTQPLEAADPRKGPA